MYTNMGFQPAYTAYSRNVGFQGFPFRKKPDEFRLTKEEKNKIKDYQMFLKMDVPDSTMDLRLNAHEIVDYINGKKAEPTITVNKREKSVENFIDGEELISNLKKRRKNNKELYYFSRMLSKVSSSANNFSDDKTMDKINIGDDKMMKIVELKQSLEWAKPLLRTIYINERGTSEIE